MSILFFFKTNKENLILILGSALSRFLFILIGFLIIKMVGSKFYGGYVLVYNLILVFQVLCTFGLTSIVTKYIAKGFDLNIVLKKACKCSFFISIGVFSILYILLELMNINYLKPLRSISFPVFCFSVITVVLYSLLISILYGIYDRILVAKINLFNVFLVFISLVSLCVFEIYSLLVLFIGMSNLICIFLLLRVLSKRKGTQLINVTSFQLVKESTPLFFSDLLVTPVISLLYYLLSNYNEENVSVFSVAMQWYSVVLFIPGVLSNLYLSKFSKENENISIRSYNKILLLNFFICVLVAFLCSLALHVILPMYGELYLEKINIFYLFLISAVFTSLGTISGQVLIAKNKQQYGFVFNLIWAIIVLISSLIFLENFHDVFAIALAYLVAYFFHVLIQNIYIYRLLKVTYVRDSYC